MKKLSLKRILLVLSATIISILSFELTVSILNQLIPMKYRSFNILGEKDSAVFDSLKREISGIDVNNSFIIYYLGESTMEGDPYFDKLNIPQLVSVFLKDEINGKPLIPINLGKSGVIFDYHLNRISLISRYKKIFNPSLVVIYSGHNEIASRYDGTGLSVKNKDDQLTRMLNSTFLVSSSLKLLGKRKLEIDERSFFDKPLFNSKQKAEVINIFREEVNQAVNLLKTEKIPVIFITQVGNYADWEPSRSIFCERKNDMKYEFLNLFKTALEYEKIGNLKTALEYYQLAEDICPTFAEISFRKGKIYEKQGDFNSAWFAFKKGIDNDGAPIWAVSEINDFIRSLENNEDIYIVDAENYLRQYSENHLIGYNLMIDGHHPNDRGYLLMSKALAEKIKNIYKIQRYNLKIEYKDIVNMFPLNSNDLNRIYTDKGDWIIRMSSWKYDPVDRLAKAEDYYNKALDYKSGNWRTYAGLSLIYFLRKDVEKAQQYLKTATEINKEETEQLIQGEEWVQNVIIRAINSE